MVRELEKANFPINSIQQDNDILLSVQDEFLRQRLYSLEPLEHRISMHKHIAEILTGFSATEHDLRMIIYHYSMGNCHIEAWNSLGQLCEQYLKQLHRQDDSFLQ